MQKRELSPNKWASLVLGWVKLSNGFAINVRGLSEKTNKQTNKHQPRRKNEVERDEDNSSHQLSFTRMHTHVLQHTHILKELQGCVPATQRLATWLAYALK